MVMVTEDYPNAEAVEAILARTAALTHDEFVRLAAATNSAFGHFGLNKAWRRAAAAIWQAAEDAGRGTAAIHARDGALAAAVAATVSFAQIRGRDSRSVSESWDTYRAGMNNRDAHQSRKATRAFNTSLKRTVGFRDANRMAEASLGAGWAAIAILMWDLVTDDGTYTPAYRDLMTKPWKAVLPLPPFLPG